MNNNLEELITALYDMIQDARSVPLSSDKCILERDKALDMLDDLSAQLPSELKQARTIVQSREELISQARREAEVIIRNARAEAEKLVEKEEIHQLAVRKCEQMRDEMNAKLDQEEAERMAEMERKAADHQRGLDQAKELVQGYVSSAMAESETAILQALESIRFINEKFLTVTGAKNASVNEFDHDL